MATNGSAPALGSWRPAELPDRTRVLVVDDHDLYRSGLCALLAEHGFELVGDVGDAGAAVESARRLRPDVVALALDLSGISAAETARRINDVLPDARIVGFLIGADEETVAEALMAGVHSCLLKDAAVEEIVDAIRVTAAGDSVLSHRVATVVVGRLRDGAHDGPAGQIGSLTEREREVLRLLVHGKSNAEIATELFVSPPTVKNHISSILGKLGADNRIQAAVEAVRRRWV